tara:strand:- start:1300 stop:1521 length:222 start_codon:yes stop_codon:yes gene_type:complete
MLGIYVIITLIVLMVAYAGMEETVQLFAYVDLMIRWQWVQFRMFMMRRKLEQQLIKDLPNFNKLAKELKDDQR